MKGNLYQATEDTSEEWYLLSCNKYHFSPVRYFGAARDLPGVRELFEQPRESRPFNGDVLAQNNI